MPTTSQQLQPLPTNQAQEHFGQQVPSSRALHVLHQPQVTRLQGPENQKLSSLVAAQTNAVQSGSQNRLPNADPEELGKSVLGKRSIHELVNQVSRKPHLTPKKQKPIHIPLFFSSSMVLISTFFFFLFISLSLSQGQPPIDPLEQKALYDVLNSLNPAIPWTTDYPDDLCLSAPHGVVCDYYPSDSDDHNVQNQQQKAHVVELNFGYVSDETPNPPCSPNATLNPLLFTSFPYL